MDQTETERIWVYKKPGSSRFTSIYLRHDCLDWLLSYAADQHHFQGVERYDPVASTLELANCSAVAGLRLTWDFSGKAWDAEFVAGAFKGGRKTFAVADLTKEQWEMMK